MSPMRSGRSAAVVRSIVAVGCRAGVAALLAVLLTGCKATTQHQANWPGEPQRLAAAAPPAAKVDLEDDGVPAQTPPSPRIRQMPDDPSEPYSRNYGSALPRTAASAPAGRGLAAIPDDLPPAFRAKLAAALDDE